MGAHVVGIKTQVEAIFGDGPIEIALFEQFTSKVLVVPYVAHWGTPRSWLGRAGFLRWQLILEKYSRPIIEPNRPPGSELDP